MASWTTNTSNFQNRSDFNEDMVFGKEEKKDSFIHLFPSKMSIFLSLSSTSISTPLRHSGHSFNFHLNSIKILSPQFQRNGFVFKSEYECFACKHIYTPSACRAGWEHQRPWNWSHRWLWTAMWIPNLGPLESHLSGSGINFWNAILVSCSLVRKSQCFKVSEYLNNPKCSGTKGRSMWVKGQPNLHSKAITPGYHGCLVRLWLKIKSK